MWGLTFEQSLANWAPKEFRRRLMEQVRSESESKTPMWVTCSACNHRWIGLYLPMPIDDAAKAMGRLTCPKCVCTKIFVAPGAVETECLRARVIPTI